MLAWRQLRRIACGDTDELPTLVGEAGCNECTLRLAVDRMHAERPADVCRSLLVSTQRQPRVEPRLLPKEGLHSCLRGAMAALTARFIAPDVKRRTIALKVGVNVASPRGPRRSGCRPDWCRGRTRPRGPGRERGPRWSSRQRRGGLRIRAGTRRSGGSGRLRRPCDASGEQACCEHHRFSSHQPSGAPTESLFSPSGSAGHAEPGVG
jgi:hypothetical protein